MPLRTLTTQQGVRNPDGTPAANISISYRLTKAFATSDRVFVPVTGAVTTDVNGIFSAQLAVPDSGSIGYSIQLPNAVVPALLSDGVGDIYLETLVATAEASGSIDYFQTLIDGADQRRADGDAALQTALDTKDHGTLLGLADNDHPQYALAAALSDYAQLAVINTFTREQIIQNDTNGELSLSARSLGVNNAPSVAAEFRHRAFGTAQNGYGADLPIWLEVVGGGEVPAFILRVTLPDASTAGVKSQLDLVGIRNNAESVLARFDPFPADTQTNMFVRHGATNTLKRVETGAPDSAGAGYRTLRVLN